MQALYIIHYCHPSCTPLQSITRLPEQEAYEKAKALSDQNKGDAFGRFADFHNYYPKRIRTEKWLYHHFVAIGGKPETEHPLYFVLQGSDYLESWFANGKATALPLFSISSEHISFTFGDSMAKMDKPERKDPFTKEELYRLIENNNGDISQFLDGIRQQYTYIEAQLWNDIYSHFAMRLK